MSTVGPNLFSLDAFYLFLSAFTILGFWMVLYKNGPWNKIVENLLLGGAVANMLVLAVPGLMNQIPIIRGGRYDLLIPMGIGILLFALFFGKKYSFYASIGSAILVGLGSGTAIKDGIWTSGAVQIGGAISKSLIGVDVWATIFNILAFTITVSGMLFFTFTIGNRGNQQLLGVYSKIARYGRFMLMGCFGVVMATNITSRGNAIITAIDPFLTTAWGPLVVLAAVVYITADILLGRRKAVVATT